jgi:hypothetical protein
MIDSTLDRLEARVRETAAVRGDREKELLQLIATLKDEIGELSQTQSEHAESIAGFAELSAREATRADKNPQLADLAIQGLSSSVREFETTHPRLTQAVNAICATLSNLGI